MRDARWPAMERHGNDAGYWATARASFGDEGMMAGPIGCSASFAMRRALASKVSSAIFCARLTSPVATLSAVRHPERAIFPSASSSWMLKTQPR
jgi:hypothetical protein